LTSPEAWQRAEPLLDELLELDAAARAARLLELESGDPALAAQLREMLAAAETEELLSRPAAEFAALLGTAEGLPSRIGEHVGPFRITDEIGRGGMGAVYAAGRVEGGFDQQVAIKVLKRGTDSEHVLRRFLAERQILARLEHPHIARLLDGGITEDGLPWFAMERVDGEWITAHVDRQRLPLPERLALFLDVCDAVAFAHGQRVVHRDIKPSNVLVSAEGRVKLVDFGIAKLLDPSEEKLTRTGMVVMTPHYAAPEQRLGNEITTATDVWQLGSLLREMLPAPLPRDLERVVAQACHEEPARRYASAGALAEDVRAFTDGRPVAARGDSAAYRLSRVARRNRSAVATGVLALAGVGAWIALGRSLDRSPTASLRFQLVSTFPGSHRQASFSPDGKSIAFLMEDPSGTPQVFAKDLTAGDPLQLTRDERGANRPRWSPAGEQIVYDVPGAGIWSVAASGGTARQVLQEGFNPNLSPDGRQLVYEVDAQLWTARSDGSGARVLGDGAGNLEKEYAFVGSTPAFSADGREVVYFQDHDAPILGDLWSLPLDGGARRRLTFDDVTTSHPVWLPDGSGIVYSSARRGGLTLWFQRASGGEPRALTTGTGEDTEAAVSRDGQRLIYTNARNLLRLMWLDPATGRKRQLLESRSVLTHPAFSPDGSRIAVFQGDARNVQLWSLRSDGSELRQLTTGDQSSVLPDWSADGAWLYHYQLPPQAGFRRVSAKGGVPEMLIPGWRFTVEHAAHVSPDDARIAYTLLDHGRPLAARIRDRATGVERALAEPILWPRWSPDGKLLAGRGRSRELTLCRASDGACRGLGVDGTEPRWSADGKQVYFVRYAGYQGSRDPRAMPLWRIDADGSRPTHVADLEGPSAESFFYDVSARGEVAWASFVPGRQELWMAELPPLR
jgi:Tol biopolymer transport system component